MQSGAGNSGGYRYEPSETVTEAKVGRLVLGIRRGEVSEVSGGSCPESRDFEIFASVSKVIATIFGRKEKEEETGAQETRSRLR